MLVLIEVFCVYSYSPLDFYMFIVYKVKQTKFINSESTVYLKKICFPKRKIDFEIISVV